MCGGFKPKLIKKIINFLIKRFGMVAIDMDDVKPTPDKWFKPIPWDTKTRNTHSCYLEVIGGFKDSFDNEGTPHRHEMI
jgi:hypothetical protein